MLTKYQKVKEILEKKENYEVAIFAEEDEYVLGIAYDFELKHYYIEGLFQIFSGYIYREIRVYRRTDKSVVYEINDVLQSPTNPVNMTRSIDIAVHLALLVGKGLNRVMKNIEDNKRRIETLTNSIKNRNTLEQFPIMEGLIKELKEKNYEIQIKENLLFVTYKTELGLHYKGYMEAIVYDTYIYFAWWVTNDGKITRSRHLNITYNSNYVEATIGILKITTRMLTYISNWQDGNRHK